MPHPTSKQALPSKAGEIDQLRQVVQLVEAIVIQVVEKRLGADRMTGHLQVVDAVVPVALYLVDHDPLSYNDLLMTRDLRRLADYQIRRGRRGSGLLRRHDRVGRGPARPVGGDHRQGRLRRGDVVQQPEDPARRPAFAERAQLHADAAVHPRAARAGARGSPPGAAAAVRRHHDPQPHAQLAGVADAAGAQRRDGARPQRRACRIPGPHLPPGQIVSRDEALRLNPVVSPTRA